MILDEEEKFGGLPVSLDEVDNFRHCINTCNLSNLGFKGSIFTRWNGRSEEDCIFKRLDHCLRNMELQQTFPGLEVTHLSKIGSDHRPMLLKCDIKDAPIKKSFRFLNFWIKHDTFKVVVREIWSADFSANPFILFNHKLKKLKKALSTWSRATYGDIFQKISSLEEVVLVYERQFEAYPTRMNRARLHKVQAEIIRYLALEEENTKFFHAQVNGRRKILQLKRIQNISGNWIDEEEQIAAEAVNYFKDQFCENVALSAFYIIDNVPYLVNIEQNEKLISMPTREEWPTTSQMCDTHKSGPTAKEEGDEQARFVKGRSIVENVLLIQEIITDIRLRTKAGPNVVIKLDMTKAYDRLSWLFLTKMPRKFGFGERFIVLVFNIVGDNWYSVLVNGQLHGFFKSSRCLKQGDPLSPTLFILAAEALSRGLNALHLNLYFCGFGLPKWSPKINHLTYADDTIIFSSSDATSLRLVMEVIYLYETAFGQLVNKGKSAIYMHHSTDLEVVRKVERITALWEVTVGIGLHGTPSLWSCFMSQKSCKKLNAVVVPWRRNRSHVWRKMLECRDLIEHQITWQPNLGSSLFWYDNWTGLGALYFLVPPEFGIDEGIHNVYDVVENGSWNVDRLLEALLEEYAMHILEKIRPLIKNNVLDTPYWMLETRGNFSVKSA
ncbi:PREDICTED: uncharacterized protein LOC109241326 [Nicotiana attenuata]|uniref:uncharacterized protein LOC109241326 n=1 Tax=Nicotiana attenuata TaxID=49451 RepID=UPI000904E140|nr:PREDICTED: uncharacterized protein LOC109241326 [Nicotiana attenuata]